MLRFVDWWRFTEFPKDFLAFIFRLRFSNKGKGQQLFSTKHCITFQKTSTLNLKSLSGIHIRSVLASFLHGLFDSRKEHGTTYIRHHQHIILAFLLLLLLLLLFLTAVVFSPSGSSLTPVQTPQYNNTWINGTAQIPEHVLAIHPHNTMCLHEYNIPTQVQYNYANTIYPHITKYLQKYDIPTKYNIPTQIQYTYTITIYPDKYNIPTQYNIPTEIHSTLTSTILVILKISFPGTCRYYARLPYIYIEWIAWKPCEMKRNVCSLRSEV
jgi:hypothetical protein